MGGVQNSSGNSGGMGDGRGILVVKNSGNSGGGRWGLREIPSVVGVWIFSGTTHSKQKQIFPKREQY